MLGTKWVAPKEGSTIEDLLDALDHSRLRVVLNSDKLELVFDNLLRIGNEFGTDAQTNLSLTNEPLQDYDLDRMLKVEV